MCRLCLLLALILAASVPAIAVQPDETLADAALEARARALSKELRCMVCQNQSIDDSDAPLARDLRLLVRERLQAGDSDRQVIDFLVARYGEFVLLRPRFSAHTALLWLGPATILLIGAGFLVLLAYRSRRRSRTQVASGEPATLTAAEQARLSAIMQQAELRQTEPAASH
jgi:cytochrome c-type biogenesis protein CcmH